MKELPDIYTQYGNFVITCIIRILREINFEEPQCLKLPLLPFLGSEFCLFGKFLSSKSAKIYKNPNSKPLNGIFSILESPYTDFT